jgi:hypothetical protein
MNMDSPDRVRGRLCFRWNDGKRPERGSGQAQVKAGMTEPGTMSRSYSVTPGLTRGPCRTAEGRRRYSGSFRQPFRRLVQMNMDSPDRVRGRLCFRRNDGKRPDRGSGQAQVKAGMTEPGTMSRSYSVTPGLTRGPCRTAEGRRRYCGSFRKPFRRLVPMNMDSCFRRNDGKRPDHGSWRTLSGMLQQPVTPGEDPGSMSNG